MDYQERIRSERDGMSKSFAKLADYLLDSYIEASFMTASELAHALNLDAATVVRFSQYLAYKGFPELQREIRRKVKADLLIRPAEALEPDSVPGVAGATIRSLVKDLEQTALSLDTHALEDLCEQVGAADRILILADSQARLAAYILQRSLEQGRFKVFITRPEAQELARTLHTASFRDLVLAIDIGGQSTFIVQALQAANSREIPTAAIVSTPSLPSARTAGAILSGQAKNSYISEAVTVAALVSVVVETIHWRYKERFHGADQAIETLTNMIQLGYE